MAGTFLDDSHLRRPLPRGAPESFGDAEDRKETLDTAFWTRFGEFMADEGEKHPYHAIRLYRVVGHG